MSISPERRIIESSRFAIAGIALVSLLQNPSDNKHNKVITYDKVIKHVDPHDIGSLVIPKIVSIKPQPTTTSSSLHNHYSHTNNTHPNAHLSPALVASRQVTSAERAAWSKVNICEEGGNWHVSGSKFSGGLGISNVNWKKYGGEQFTHTAAVATPDEQIVVAMRIQHNPPDQNGCSGSW